MRRLPVSSRKQAGPLLPRPEIAWRLGVVALLMTSFEGRRTFRLRVRRWRQTAPRTAFSPGGLRREPGSTAVVQRTSTPERRDAHGAVTGVAVFRVSPGL